MPISSLRKSRAERARAVFINCPFDPDYRPLFRAMCFTILRCGYNPCCALDFSDSGESRFHRILDLILDCGMSIHDISRVQLDGASGLPRFNMPLELGADLGLRLKGPLKQRDRRLLILETEKHRYDVTTSDLSGQDIEAHYDNQSDIIARVRDWLNAGREGERPLPGSDVIQAGYLAYLNALPELITADGLDPFDRLPHADFLWTVYVALAEIERQPAIKPGA
jgi:hypothetical protein